MAAKPSTGDSLPLSVVRKDADARENVPPEDDRANGSPERNDNSERKDQTSMSEDISARLSELKEQIQTLKASMADAQKAAVTTVSNAAASAGESSRSTVRAYPLASIALAGLFGIIVGRLTAGHPIPVYEGAFDELRNSLTKLANDLPPQIKASLRSSLR